MNTTETILKGLQRQLDEAMAAGKSAAERDVRQQIVAHEALAQLRAEHEANPSDGLASQIRSWQRKVWQDIDPPAPKRKRTSAPAEPPAEPVSEPE